MTTNAAYSLFNMLFIVTLRHWKATKSLESQRLNYVQLKFTVNCIFVYSNFETQEPVLMHVIIFQQYISFHVSLGMLSWSPVSFTSSICWWVQLLDIFCHSRIPSSPSFLTHLTVLVIMTALTAVTLLNTGHSFGLWKLLSGPPSM